MNESQVFISYDYPHKKWVREFVAELERQGVNVWLDEKEIALGEPIADKLEEALRSSDSFVFVLGPGNLESANVFFELGAALGAGRRVIAVVDKDIQLKDLPAPIRKRRYLMMETPQETAREVAEALTSTRTA